MGNQHPEKSQLSPIRIIEKIPDDIFSAVRKDVQNIDWNNLPVPDLRSRVSVFATSVSIHLRVHRIGRDTPDTAAARSEIIDCVDTNARSLYPGVELAVQWILKRVQGQQLGRMMLVKLEGRGNVGGHIDRGSYFRFHRRFHLPIVTNPSVNFSGPIGERPAHMPEQFLCQLLNQNLHGVENNSDQDRIHLILDIGTAGSEFSYPVEA